MIDLEEIKNKIIKRENFYLLIVILIIFSLDRYSKNVIMKNFSENVFYINDFVNFDLIWNTGIGFGLLDFNSEFIYKSITILIAFLIILLIYFASISDKYDRIVFAIIIGGALGNFYDRVTINAVPDFIDLHFGQFHWFTFNVADIFITIGVILFLMKNLIIKQKKT